MHGTVDNLVPVEQARQFVLALRAVLPETVVYVELPGAPHAFDVVRSGPHRRGAGRHRAVRHLGSDGRGRRRFSSRRRNRNERSDDHGAYGAIVNPARPSSTAS